MIKYIINIVFICIIIIFNISYVFASDIDKSVTDLSMSEIKNSSANVEFIPEEYEDETIECYAIGENNIAIGLNNYINIYDLNGDFKYGIKCYMSSAYFLEYIDDNLYIYLHRSSKCIKITGYQEPVYYYSVNDTKSNYDIISNKLKNVRSDIIKDSVIYKVGGINNTKLVKIDEDNTEKVIYNSTFNVWLKFVVVFIGVIIFAFVVLYNIFKMNKEDNIKSYYSL